MAHPGGAVNRRSRTRLLVAAAVLTTLATACAQPEPDEQEVTRAVSALPGVIGVDASFIGRDLGSGGDQSIEVELADPPDPDTVEQLTTSLPRALRSIEHADGYDEFILSVPHPRLGDRRPATSKLTWGPGPVADGLPRRWAEAIGQEPPGGVSVRLPADRRPASASISGVAEVHESLAWALDTELTDLPWTFSQYLTPGSPYVRFAPRSPLASEMVEQWRAIQQAAKGPPGERSRFTWIVVEHVEQTKRVTIAVSFPGVTGVVDEATHGPVVWPLVAAIARSNPADRALDLRLRSERDKEATPGGSGVKADLVDRGKGQSDWEAAYRQRFPDAASVSAPPG